MGKIWQFLTGEISYSFPLQDTVPVLEKLRQNGIFYNRFYRNDEFCSVTVSFFKKRRMEKVFEKWEYSPIAKWHGVPALLYRYRKRVAIPIGLFFLGFLIYVSSQYIWCFEVTGNRSVSDEEIIAGLTELGCGIGAKIHALEMDAIENEFVFRSDSVSWISVNIKGTTARVEVRELLSGEENPQGTICANVVAKEAGEVVYIEVAEGQNIVKAGKSVKEGELLISGVVESKNGETRFEYAAGKVMAKVSRRITVEINTETEEKIYTGREIIRKSVNIFGKRINLSINTGKIPLLCDMMIMEEAVSLFREASLPMTVTTCFYREYKMVKRVVSKEEAVATALAELRKQMDQKLEDAELLEKTVSSGFIDGVYRIDCELYVLTDIAGTQEITIYQNGEEYGTETD